MTARRDEESGVATVLGAILMFGLLVITLITIQVQYVPVWDREKERDASILAARQVAQVKADLDHLVGNVTNIPISDPISLVHEQGFSLFGRDPIPGRMTFTPTSASAGMTVATGRPVSLQSAGGQSLYALSEDYATWTGSQITGILEIAHLRMRIPSPAGLPTGTQTFDLLIKDANGNCQGEVKLVATGTTLSTKSIEAQVFGPQSPVAATCSTTAVFVEDTYLGLATPAYYYFDPLSPDAKFGAVLAAFPGALLPMTASFTQGLTNTQVAMVYDQQTVYGRVRTGGTGQALPSYLQTVPSGVLSIAIQNQQLASQTYSFEYGAVFLDQSDGSAMLIAPEFSVGTTASQGAISWAFPALSGGSASVTGSRSGTVVAASTNTRDDVVMAARDITFTISTTHVAQWTAYWQERMALAGVSATAVASQAPCTLLTSNAQYSITPVTGGVQLTYLGPCSDANDTTKDVLVTFQDAVLALQLRPAG